MKKLFFAFLLVSGFFLQRADAQVRVNINIGNQPEWGPYGYDYAQFYYMPDIDVYYDVLNNEFVYFDGFDWRYSPYLPTMYSNFDLYNAYKVVINEPRPYLRADYYRRQYYSYRGYHNQPVLRDYRNRGYDDRRNGGFEQRNYGYQGRDQRYDDHNRVEGNNRNFGQRDNRNFDQRDNRNFGEGNNRNFDQRGGQNSGQRNNGFEQRNNGSVDQRDNRNSDQRDNRNFDQRGSGNADQRDNRSSDQGGNRDANGRGNNQGGFGQRNDSRSSGRH